MARSAENGERSLNDYIYGDLFQAIISQVPLIDLLPAYYVSNDWRCAVRLSLTSPSRHRPWLIVHIQKSHKFSSVTALGYDPETRVWIEIPTAKTPFPLLPVRSSHSNLVYTLEPSKFSFSVDALSAKWYDVDGPKVWRLDPVVAVIGSDIVMAGGTYDFEDNPLAVEIYNCRTRRWEICQSMPDDLKESAASPWLSVAVSDRKMFLIEKNSGVFCSFDPKTRMWDDVIDLKPDQSIFHSLIGYSGNRLVLIGLLGAAENVQSLRIWEVDCETFYCKEVGEEMPSRLLKGLGCSDSCLPPTSINISMEKDVVYIYNTCYPKEIVFCELSEVGSCKWGSIQNSVVNDQNPLHRFVFTCSKVGLNDLQKVFGASRVPSV